MRFVGDAMGPVRCMRRWPPIDVGQATCMQTRTPQEIHATGRAEPEAFPPRLHAITPFTLFSDFPAVAPTPCMMIASEIARIRGDSSNQRHS
ncbi:hypothetical protein [Burkholderia perseverans]|uniref:hypothetical protein n=1 Tax=Burkholderia perseverans TaxID=2615214 RepID=UPI001FEFB396|nr:hypothetical protein [Burkholderia perseverans]